MTSHHVTEVRDQAHRARTALREKPLRGVVLFCLVCGAVASVLGALAAALVPHGQARVVVWVVTALLFAAATGFRVGYLGVRTGPGHRGPDRTGTPARHR
ncbi:hypothetical protein ACIBL6_00300 [Streptomyces sp. NPDC050400]|uniref:hypothetical protein n=1 Tax=Streptomyces sp. NPDC050400 TaxID=3365610 RepID=UPI0037AEA5AB